MCFTCSRAVTWKLRERSRSHILEIISDLSEKTLQLIDSDLRRMIHPKLLSWLKQQSISIEELRFLYFGNKPVSMETVMNYCELMGDMLFYRGLYEVADIQIRLGHHSTYMYKFSYEKENSYYKLAMNINQPGIL